MLYAVVFTRGCKLPIERDFSMICPNVYSLAQAKARRVCAGDLVVNATTLEVIVSDEWLFDWEKVDPNCYARQMQKWQSLESGPVNDTPEVRKLLFLSEGYCHFCHTEEQAKNGENPKPIVFSTVEASHIGICQGCAFDAQQMFYQFIR